jgi:hypothetical protein
MISENRDALNDFFDLGKIRELLDVQRRGDDSVTRKILAILLILSGLQVCRNGKPLNELSLNHGESLTNASAKDQF